MGLYQFFSGLFGGKTTSGYEVIDRIQTNQLPQTPRPQVASKELTSHNRRDILSQSRYIYRSDGTIKELVDNMALYSIGTGITPQPLSSNSAFNNKIQADFLRWWNKPEITGRFTGRDVQKFISTAYDVDGEIFIIKTKDKHTNEPKIQLIESQQVKTDSEHNDYESGIKFDEYGKPLSYLIELSSGQFTEVPASSVIHIFNAERATSTRGISTFTHLLSLTNQRTELLDLTLQKARQEAKFVNAIEQTKSDNTLSASDYLNGMSDSSDEEQSLFESASRVSSVIGGTTVSLPSGMTLKQLSNNTPGNSYLGFAEQLLKLSSCGLMPYGFTDPSNLTGVSVRMTIAKAARVISDRQELICKVMEEIYHYFLGWMLSSEEYSSISEDVSDLFSVTWQCPRSVTVDYGKDEKTDLILLQQGVKPIEDYYAERGLDFTTEAKKRLDALSQLKNQCKALNINPEAAFPAIFKP